MTLVVALKCTDGVVLATDSQATSGARGAFPWEFYNVRELGIPKIHAINKCCVMAIAGAVSFSQDIERRLDIKKLSDEYCFSVKDAISSVIWDITRGKIEKFSSIYPYPENERKASQYLGDVVFVGFDGDDSIRIFYIDQHGESEEIESFCSIGSGEVFTRSTLINFYKGNTTTLDYQAGEVLAYTLIKDAEKTGAYGVGSPIRIQTFRFDDKKELCIQNKFEENEDEIQPIRDVYNSLKESLVSGFKIKDSKLNIEKDTVSISNETSVCPGDE